MFQCGYALIQLYMTLLKLSMFLFHLQKPDSKTLDAVTSFRVSDFMDITDLCATGEDLCWVCCHKTDEIRLVDRGGNVLKSVLVAFGGCQGLVACGYRRHRVHILSQ